MKKILTSIYWKARYYLLLAGTVLVVGLPGTTMAACLLGLVGQPDGV